MPITYLKTTANNNGYLVRPTNYIYPIGLNASTFSNTIEYLVVAGGGGGGTAPSGVPSWRGAGGGAGGLKTASGYSVTSSTPYAVTVGSGGPAQTAGSASSFNSPSVTTTGGGKGGNAFPSGTAGTSGGSGGGGGSGGAGNNYGAGTPGQGYDGGGGDAGGFVAGQGGGAGGLGLGILEPAHVYNAYSQPNGLFSSISGSSVEYADGGATNSGTANYTTPPYGPGTPNTGMGGGGANGTPGTGYAGGSGVVIIRYPGTQQGTGGTITSTGSAPANYTVHTFTGPGAFVTNASFQWASGYSIN